MESKSSSGVVTMSSDSSHWGTPWNSAVTFRWRIWSSIMLFGTETHSTVECPEKIFPGGQHFVTCDSDDTFVENNIRIPRNTNLIVNMMYEIKIQLFFYCTQTTSFNYPLFRHRSALRANYYCPVVTSVQVHLKSIFFIRRTRVCILHFSFFEI